jgi:hypothetical protein
MKKNVILLSLFMITLTATIFTGCSKDDTTSPVITLTGAASIELPLNSSPWTDLGATANDDADGAVTVTSDASSTNPDVNRAGVYTISYTTQDKAGNVAVEIRTITVYNQAKDFAGIYATSVDSCLTTPPSDFTATITLSDTINNLVKIQNFGAYGSNITVFAKINGTTTGSSVTVDLGQSLGGNASITSINASESKVVSGTATSTSFTIKYGWTDGVANDDCKTYYRR